MDKLDVAIIDCEASSRLTAPAYLAWQRIKEAAKQAPPAAAVPEGYALVPVEPTDDMVWAGKSAFATAYNAMHKGERRSPVSETWAAMIAAAKENTDD